MNIGFNYEFTTKNVEDRALYSEAYLKLADYSLLQVSKKQRMVRLHRLIKVLLEERFDELELSKRWHIWNMATAGFMYYIHERHSSGERDLQNVRQNIKHIPHMQTLVEVFYKLKGAEYPTRNILLERIIWLLKTLGDTYRISGNAKLYVKCLEDVLAIEEFIYGKESLKLVKTLEFLGHACVHGFFLDADDAVKKARNYLNSALKIKQDHKDTATNKARTLMELACAYGCVHNLDRHKNQDNISEQIKCLDEAFSLVNSEKEHDKDHAYILYRIGGSYVNLNRFEKGLEVLNKALEIDKNYEESEQTAFILACLGNAQVKLNKLPEGRGLLERALGIHEKIGVDKESTVNLLHNLSDSYDDTETKKKYLERALNIQSEYYGGDHPSMLETLRRLLNIYPQNDTKQLFERIFFIKEKFYGDSHPTTVDALISLGSNCVNRSDFKEGKDLLERALNVQKNRPDKYQHQQIARTLAFLSAACMQLGEQESLKRYLKEVVLIIEEKCHREDIHLDIAITFKILAAAYGCSCLNDKIMAKRYLERALVIQEKHYEEAGHLEIVETLRSLAYVCDEKEFLYRALATISICLSSSDQISNVALSSGNSGDEERREQQAQSQYSGLASSVSGNPYQFCVKQTEASIEEIEKKADSSCSCVIL